ncbi:SKN1-domain-containing protein [Exidia glandulosa HHB12029]|uniref:SKN1-domain-containing protein n=1 Tax=Exidia glandulosa HHB12029 TaxID=1314781 RepID=A0A165DTV5_EXIGL|nr:SKN1-domain-containing protein [Exidia glandulosa HHB12029]
MADPTPASPTTPQHGAEDALLSTSPSSSSTISTEPPPPVPPKNPSPDLQPAYIGSRLNPNANPRSRPSSRAVSSDDPAMGFPAGSIGGNRGSMVLYRLASEEEQLLAGAPNQAAALHPPSTLGGANLNRFSRVSSTGSIMSLADRDSKYPGHNGLIPSPGAFVPYEYDPHEYDDLDAADDDLDEKALRRTGGFNVRGFVNVAAILLLTSAIIALFTGYPIVSAVLTDPVKQLISSNTQVNGTGQAAVLANIPKLVDPETPDDAKTRTGFDGFEYDLVFSDEFNTDNRTFAPGDDPFWEAVDLYYWATRDQEWYDPDQVTTADGFLRIKLEVVDPSINHALDLKSGMLQSWNKFCFSSGYIEIRAQLPGAPNVAGYWPGAWTMGNLARPGYGATTDGVWPYTYDSCDNGILRNQSADGINPPQAFGLDPSVGRQQYNYDLLGGVYVVWNRLSLPKSGLMSASRGSGIRETGLKVEKCISQAVFVKNLAIVSPSRRWFIKTAGLRPPRTEQESPIRGVGGA